MRAYARAIARAVKTIDETLIFVGLPGSELQKAAESEGLAFAREGFCDRRYHDDGSLMARSIAGSVLHDPEAAAAQAIRFACEGEIVSVSGAILKAQVDTLCIHGDEPGSVEVASAVRSALEKAGVKLSPMRAA